MTLQPNTARRDPCGDGALNHAEQAVVHLFYRRVNAVSIKDLVGVSD